MWRSSTQELEAWRQRPDRKPLVIRGARQVGKSFLVEDFAASRLDGCRTLNFERDPSLAALFDSPDPRETVRWIELKLGAPLRPGSTLLFLDEIQAAPQVLAKLRYFAEELPDQHVIAAGSLLDFVLEDHAFSMPVGRISYLHLEPMTFEEFLVAAGHPQLKEFLEQFDFLQTVPEPIHDQLTELLRVYMVCGGMPAVQNAWFATHSLVEVQRVQLELLSTIRDDFSKYREAVRTDRLRRVFDALPSCVGRKVVAAEIDREQRAGPIKEAFRMLCLARVATAVRRSACNGVPLGAEVDPAYVKALLLDVGLYSAQAGLDATHLKAAGDLTLVNSGQLAEQYVGQELRSARPVHREPELFCWVRAQRTSNAEVDYVIQHGNRIVPIEVKAGATGRLRSLQVFLREKRLGLGVRICGAPPSTLDTVTALPTGGEQVPFRLLSLPLYLTGQIHRLLAAEFGE